MNYFNTYFLVPHLKRFRPLVLIISILFIGLLLSWKVTYPVLCIGSLPLIFLSFFLGNLSNFKRIDLYENEIHVDLMKFTLDELVKLSAVIITAKGGETSFIEVKLIANHQGKIYFFEGRVKEKNKDKRKRIIQSFNEKIESYKKINPKINEEAHNIFEEDLSNNTKYVFYSISSIIYCIFLIFSFIFLNSSKSIQGSELNHFILIPLSFGALVGLAHYKLLTYFKKSKYPLALNAQIIKKRNRKLAAFVCGTIAYLFASSFTPYANEFYGPQIFLEVNVELVRKQYVHKGNTYTTVLSSRVLDQKFTFHYPARLAEKFVVGKNYAFLVKRGSLGGFYFISKKDKITEEKVVKI